MKVPRAYTDTHAHTAGRRQTRAGALPGSGLFPTHGPGPARTRTLPTTGVGQAETRRSLDLTGYSFHTRGREHITGHSSLALKRIYFCKI